MTYDSIFCFSADDSDARQVRLIEISDAAVLLIKCFLRVARQWLTLQLASRCVLKGIECNGEIVSFVIISGNYLLRSVSSVFFNCFDVDPV